MSMQNLLNTGDRFTTNNGLILEVVDYASLSVGDGDHDIQAEDFITSMCVGRVSGNDSDLPRNVFIHRARDGMRFKQAGDDADTNFAAAYVAPAPATATTAGSSAWAAQAVTQTVSSNQPPAGAPAVGDRAETANGLVVEVISLALQGTQWVVTTRAIGRTSRAPEHVRGRDLPRATMLYDAITGKRVNVRLTSVNTDIIRGFEGTPPFDYDKGVAGDPAPAAPVVRSAFLRPADTDVIDDDMPV